MPSGFSASEAWPQTNERCSEASPPIPQMRWPIQKRKLLHEQRGGVCPRHFPSLTLHSSTQQSVNPEGIPYFSPGFLNPGYPTPPLIPTPSAVAYRRSNERRYSATGLPRYATRSGLIQIGGDSPGFGNPYMCYLLKGIRVRTSDPSRPRDRETLGPSRPEPSEIRGRPISCQPEQSPGPPSKREPEYKEGSP